MLTVFTDFHHAALLQSFILLFERRLGGRVYRPIGMDWSREGFWHVYDHPATQAQFLGIGSATPDGTDPLNTVIGYEDSGVYLCHDIDSWKYNRAMTLTAFRAAPVDIIIASIPAHILPYYKLAQIHTNKPKVIYQIGNSWDVTDKMPVKNIMVSARLPFVTPGFHWISYHQEFDLSTFYPLDVDNIDYTTKNVYSFVNIFGGQAHFADDWQLFLNVEKKMPDWTFRSYGGQCRDGAAHGSRSLANRMRKASFIWHTKWGGDGYGHVIHNAAATAVPMIVKLEYYKGRMGGDLLIDGVTCIGIDRLNVNQIVQKILYYREPMRYRTLVENMIAQFKKTVDFDREEQELRKFLAELQ